MIRRSFLTSLGKAAAASLSPTFLGAMPLPRAAQDSPAPAAEITNGSSVLRFIPGNAGLGIELSLRQGSSLRRVGSVQNPVRIFYDHRGNGSETDVAFASVKPAGDGLLATADVTDTHHNKWSIKLNVSKWRGEGFQFDFRYKLVEGDAENVFLSHSIAPDLAATPEGTYVFMPGLLYDGNTKSIPDGEIPRLIEADQFQVDTPVLSLSTPLTMLYEKASGMTLVTRTEVESGLGPSGFSYAMRPGQHQLAVVTPLYRERHFRGHHYDDCTPAGANVTHGDTFNVTVYHMAAHYAALPELFAAYQALREPAPFQRTPRLPMSEAANVIEKNFNVVNWCQEGFYINASPPDYDPAKKGCESLPTDWDLITGWCAGAITGYALLKVGDEQSHPRAVTMIDLIADGGVSPSGLFWSNYGRGQWDKGNARIAMNQHMRMPADATFFILKSIALEKSRGREHPAWVRAVECNLDAFLKLWRDNRDFGHFVNRETLKIEQTGSAAGALCIAALALGANLPHGKEYLAAAEEAAEAYYHRYVETGWLVGGPLDIGIAPDSESATAMLESFVTLYEAARNPKYLEYAQVAADILSSWVVAYNAPFPEGTDCDRIKLQTVGGVLANTRNHHIGPTMATSSGDMFLRLYRYTGKAVYLRVLQEVVSGLPQYLCYAPGQFDEMQVGMMSEQYNMTDELGTRGHIWQVNAGWGATGLLLSYGALPSVYVDRKRRDVAVFDQLTASADFSANRLDIMNETPFEARVSVATEADHRTEFVLPSGHSKTVALEDLGVRS
jgi:hypothetical protein